MKTTSSPIFDQPLKKMLTRKEVAFLAGVCTHTVALDVKKGLLPEDRKNRRRLRYDPDDVRVYCGARRVPQSAPATQVYHTSEIDGDDARNVGRTELAFGQDEIASELSLERATPLAREEKWKTLEQMAARYQVPVRILGDLVAEGCLPHYALGNCLRFEPEECDLALKILRQNAQLPEGNQTCKKGMPNTVKAPGPKSKQSAALHQKVLSSKGGRQIAGKQETDTINNNDFSPETSDEAKNEAPFIAKTIGFPNKSGRKSAKKGSPHYNGVFHQCVKSSYFLTSGPDGRWVWSTLTPVDEAPLHQFSVSYFDRTLGQNSSLYLVTNHFHNPILN
jgi:hypothetical protein